MRYLMDCVTFLHIGLGQVLIPTNSGESPGTAAASARRWLDRYAPGYRKAGHDLRWNRAHDNVQLRILIERWVFRARLMPPALRAYRLFMRWGGKENKW